MKDNYSFAQSIWQPVVQPPVPSSSSADEPSPTEKTPAIEQPRAKRGQQVVADEFGLSERQRDVLQARVTDDGHKRSREEIASLLFISVDYVHVLLSKARKQLRDRNLTETEYRQRLGLPGITGKSKASAGARKRGRPRKETSSGDRLLEKRKVERPNARSERPATNPTVVRASDSRSDVELILSFRRGDQTAVTHLLKRYGKYIDQAIHKADIDAAEMDDMRQLVYTHIWRGLKSLKDPAKIRAWITTIVKNTWKDRLRKVVPERNSVAYSVDEPFGEDDDSKREFVAGKKWQPCQQTDDKDMEKLLLEAIAKISSSSFRACLRHRIEGHSYGEIASLTGIELGTVKSQIARSRAQLKQILLDNPPRYQPVIDEMRALGFIE